MKEEFLEFFKFLAMDGSVLITLFLAVTWIIMLLQQRFSLQNTSKGLLGSSDWITSFVASVGGVLTPFCSCSTIPVLSGMLKAGVGFAPSFAFLVASPVVNEGVFILLFIAGYPTAGLIFIAVGLVLTSAAGVLVDRTGFGRYLSTTPQAAGATAQYVGSSTETSKWPGWRPANRFAWLAAKQELRGIAPHLVIALLIGGAIYSAVPSEILANLTDRVPLPLLYLLCALIGLPLYISPIPVIPIGLALIERGFPIGPLVTFLVAAIGTSPPEIVLLLRMFRIPLVLVHILVVMISALILGWVTALAL
ncbi:MAG: permease [Burkholderiaceae bacterium]|nr:permease [Burkholderiaceae bacterium]